jgi:NitT/TauT family transport system substrate-binding protein
MKRVFFIYVCIALSLLCHCQVSAQQPKLVFSAHWLPQAQFAGYYIAKDQGFYADAGLDVEIIHPSASVNAVSYLEDGKADIVTHFLITAINAKYKGVDLINIAQYSHGSAILFVTKKMRDINTLQDFQGKRVGVWKSGFEEIPRSLLNDHGIEVEWVPILSTVNLFLIGGLDVMTVMWYNEYYQLYLSGINMDEMNTFFMSDYGYDIPEDGLYVTSQTLENRRGDLKAFVEATNRGWAYAAQNREYTVNMVVGMMREARVPSNIPHQRWMLDRVLDMMQISNEGTIQTELLPDDFRQAVEVMKKYSGHEETLDFTDFFKPVLPILKHKLSQ